MHRLRKINGIEYFDLVRFIDRDIFSLIVLFVLAVRCFLIYYFSVHTFRAAPFKHLSALHKYRAFRVSHYIGGVHLHQVRLYEKACLT